MMKRNVTIALIIFVSVHLAGQIDWVKNENPVLQSGESGSWEEKVFCPAVIKLEGTYHMWYGGMDPYGVMKIGYATSPNGITWEKYEDNPVMVAGPLESIVDRNPYLQNVVYDGTQFHMYYIGHDGDDHEYLFYATSGDGISWEKQGRPAFQDENGDPIEVNVSRGDVYFDGETFHMWAGMSNSGFYDVGYTTSDDGATWTVVDPLVMDVPPSGEWDYPRTQVATVFELEGMYHMWYSGGNLFDWDIGYATSPDGMTWTRYEDNPVMTRGEPGSWDEAYVAFPTIIWDTSELVFKMWYTANFLEGKGLGYAEATIVDGIYQKRVRDNIRCYPNPANTQITLQTGIEGVKELELFTINGQCIYRTEWNGKDKQLDVSMLNPGVYMVSVRCRGTILRKKLIIQ